HPEKVLGFTEEFATKNPKTVKAVMRAVLEASQWNDRLENRPRMAEVVGQPQYVNAAKEIILGRMLGDYDYGDGRKEKDKYYMTFYDRYTNFPQKSHGVWWLTQFRRWGMVKEAPDYKGVVDRVHRPDIYREVAQEVGVAVRGGGGKTETESKRDIFEPFFKDGEMNQGIGRLAFYSLVRVTKGYLLALAIGTPIGFFLGLSRGFHSAFDPIIQFLRPISPLAWLPLGL